ncbi:hypothetical protein D8B26_008222 [Coccidioides posadasii str. Silveira]|uniref:Uncharacterized protein n=2 Tax=Coccidioides posadasii TaxID=199306 RepID=E9DGJ9_COCPS|nr:hypothetical protein CPC735_043420 [Coccidioides posadasii C735 delta SOWgp]EER25898.1 hypothetical protein CPC735_043420 [Coccidioides posadasii C735 delta SOWgp]EFW14360.1 conserved hypothetical protein [Coccidioides posadasii str. Silveira]QVM13613.1 hypothetical protein D8B26_008222 [Coccidioides posadasii str. Silveira]|eukprot:XP_003068043.1 hypothetical protein CPC735_043420 [Coccidioides posadasii C735 delta SOWgp]
MSLPTLDSSGILPASLLWAHQLRREHKALVGQITALESSVDKTKKEVCGLNGKAGVVDKTIVSLEKAAGEMRDGMDVLRDDVSGVKAAVERLVEQRILDWEERKRLEEEAERERGMTRENRSLMDRLMEEVRGLKEEVDELRKECVKSKRTPGSLPSQRYSTLSEPPAAQPSPKAPKRARKPTRALSRISETPSSFRFRRIERPPSVELIRESLPLPPAESPAPMVDFDFTQISPISAPPSEDFLMGQQKQPSRGTKPEDPIRSLKQNALSLSNYLELGRSVLAKFPRRRDESKVVQAFWDGFNDPNDQSIVELGLERDGWSWNALQGAVRDLIEQKKKQRSRAQQNAANRRRNTTKQRKRVIPIVWSTKEEENEWLAQMGGWGAKAISNCSFE